MRKAKFKVEGRFDGAETATVEIDRGAGIFAVRPYHRHRVYELPLSTVAEFVIWRIVKAEVAAKKAKRRKRTL